MAIRLLVVGNFMDYEPGDRITDQAEIRKVLASHPDFVLREIAPAERAGDQDTGTPHIRRGRAAEADK